MSSLNLSAQNDVFPESWDSTYELRGEHSVVLTWIHVLDTELNFELKSFVVLQFKTDSLGDTTYCIAEYFENSFREGWNYAFIHFSGNAKTMGYNDMHVHEFPSKPTEGQLKALFKQWRLTSHYREPTKYIGKGIDGALWMKYLGFVPEKVF